ncbi:diiron oxygenase [Pseudomonas brassicacearum]|uniref:Aminobenzoate oxygenase n=1 Tax=Pseudomonas brassicacearum TaxID=930166 RepID=A0A423GZ33_9PSED|nr:diiron oxygenase [Pseudomonas brassicacearum]RON03648.1 aminobenzoate oxygenase [Pseudomonas brassicacearum]
MPIAINEPDSLPVSPIHRFTLGDWNNNASVRSSQNAYLLPPELERELETRDWFPPAFLPYLKHPLLEEAGKSIRHRLTANHLVYFLDYTTVLEHRIVNRAVETIIHGELDVPIPRQMKTAALQLYTDEGYHALFSNLVAEQIAVFYGIRNRPADPLRIHRLKTLINNACNKHKALAWFLVGFVSETIIAKELLDITRDSLVSTVHEMLTHHLLDEARHSRYFCEVFNYLWPTMDSHQREFAGKFLLDVISSFFEIDEPWLSENLHSVGLPTASIANILSGVSDKQAGIQRARSGAAATLRAMKKSGVFALPFNQQLFVKAGLIDV